MPSEKPLQPSSVEFWSSVEYGTFLKGLVRELGGASAAKVEGVKVEGGLEGPVCDRSGGRD